MNTNIYFIPKAILCPHCGVHYDVMEIVSKLSIIGNETGIICSVCQQLIAREYINKYFGMIKDVKF